jgi:hypothetical protein
MKSWSHVDDGRPVLGEKVLVWSECCGFAIGHITKRTRCWVDEESRPLHVTYWTRLVEPGCAEEE